MMIDKKLLLPILGTFILLLLFVYFTVTFLIKNPPQSAEELAQEKQKVTEQVLMEARGEDPTPVNILFENNKRYTLRYYEESGHFLIVILSGPLEQVRQEAEGALLKLVDNDKTKACALNPVVSVAKSVDPKYIGQNLGLSFCKTKNQ